MRATSVQIDGQRTEIRLSGPPPAADRPAMLLLHGLGGSARQWTAVAAQLPADVAVVAVDLPGHGADPRPLDTPAAALRALLCDLLDVTGCPPGVGVVGHSLGGLVALDLGLTAPERVGWLGLVATAPRIVLHPALVAGLGRGVVDERFLAAGFAPGAPPGMLAEVADGLRALRLSSPECDVWGARHRDLTSRLPDVSLPALVVVPGADQVVSPRKGRGLAQGIAGARVEVIAGAGHHVHLEAPEAVARQLVRAAWGGALHRRGWQQGATERPLADVERRYRRAGCWGTELLHDHVLAAAGSTPDAPALVDGARQVTHVVLRDLVGRTAAGLKAIGVSSSDRVLLQLPNVLELPVTLLALLRMGAVPVLVPPALGWREVSHVARTTGAVGVAVDARWRRGACRVIAHRLAREVPGVVHLLVLATAGDLRTGETDLGALGSSPERPPGEVGQDSSEVALYLLSGGTTGLPKAIPRTHRDYVYNLRRSAALTDVTAATTYLAALPVSHNFALGCPGVLGTLAAGGRAVLAGPAAEAVLPLIASEGVTATAAVPGVAVAWSEYLHRHPSDVSSLDVLQVGGARLQPADARRLLEVFGCRLQQVYGMAEGLLNFTRLDDPPAVVVGTQGRPASAADECRVVDDAGADVPCGATGELLARGPYTIRAYLADPAANAAAFTPDGYYRTGDIVRRDAAGNFVVEGRRHDFVNRGGEKVSTQELEELLAEHEDLLVTAAVAMPAPGVGEAVCVFAVAREGRRPSLRAVRAFLGECGVARFKLPERLELLEQLPLTGVGKVDRAALRASAALTTPQIAQQGSDQLQEVAHGRAH